MQYRKTLGSYLYSFDSLHEVGEYIARTPRTWRHDVSETETPDMDWDLCAGYPAAVKMAQDGWIEGAKKSQDALKEFVPSTPRPDTKADFYGFHPHVPRFCAGAPDSMIRHTDNGTSGAARVLTLAVPVNALGYVSARSMANFGVAVAQYINQLETDGTRVEVIGMIVSLVGGKRLAHSWIAKHADQPLDLAVMAFSIGHPAMFRRLGFALRERSAAPYMGYGSTVPAKMIDLINPPLGTVILNGMADANTHAQTTKAALAYITRQIDKAIEDQNNDNL